MDVTNIFLRPVNHPFIVASGEIQFDGFLCITIAIKKRKDGGIYVAWPQHVGKDSAGADKWYNDVSFTNKDDQAFADANKRAIDALILEKFNQSLVKTPAKTTSATKPAIVVKMRDVNQEPVIPQQVDTASFMSAEDLAFESELFQEDE